LIFSGCCQIKRVYDLLEQPSVVVYHFLSKEDYQSGVLWNYVTAIPFNDLFLHLEVRNGAGDINRKLLNVCVLDLVFANNQADFQGAFTESHLKSKYDKSVPA
jgi:hypothetical protein